MYLDSGKSRSHYAIFENWLKKQIDVEMAYKRAEAELIFRRIGITFAVYGDEKGTERTIPFDQIPRIIPADEWRILEDGLRQRVKCSEHVPQRYLSRRKNLESWNHSASTNL
jgi:uncharacterized circularly permuted ATP-grasp superfamily protein